MNILTDTVCPVCGKIFVMLNPEGWTYKKPVRDKSPIFYCSYHCYLKAGRKGETDRDKQTKERYEKEKLIDDMHRQGMSYRVIAEKIGLSHGHVCYLAQEYKGVKGREAALKEDP